MSLRISIENQARYLRSAIERAVAQTGSLEITIDEANAYLFQQLIPLGTGSFVPLSVDRLHEGLEALVDGGEVEINNQTKSIIVKNEFRWPSRALESTRTSVRHVIYVDAGFKKDTGGFIAWFDETTGEVFHAKADCKDSFRCEYLVILHALQNVKGINEGDEIEIRSDNDTVVNQLNHIDAINDEEIRQYALKVWQINTNFGNRISFVWIPRAKNKAGKILGS